MKGQSYAQRKWSIPFILNDRVPTFRNRLFISSLRNLGYSPIMIIMEQSVGARDAINKSETQGMTVFTLTTESGKGAARRLRKLLRKVLFRIEHAVETIYITSLSHLRFFALFHRKRIKLAYDATEGSLLYFHFKFKPLEGFMHSLMEILERKLVKVAKVDKLTLSGARAQSLPAFQKVCASTSVVHTVPALAQSASDEDRLAAGMKIGSKRVVAALGMLAGAEELEYALEVAGNVVAAYMDVLFIFFGRTSVDQNTLKRMINSRNLETSVFFLQDLPYRKMMAYLENASVGLALESGTGSIGAAGDKSMRMFSYMQAGLPIVGSAFCSGSTVAREAGCGMFVDTSSPVEVASSVAYLLTNPDKAREQGQKGLKAFRSRYNWESERQNFIGLFGGTTA